MRFKQKVALFLTGIMMVSAVGIMNPTEVRAAGETNTFTLTVPADTNITAIGWNDIGNVGVSDVSIEDGKKISVSIENGATGRTLKKTGDASKTVGYEVKKGTSSSNEAFGDSLEFTANGTQALGAVVEDFSNATVGTYEDTINFTAALASAATEVTYTRTNGSGTLSSADLGEPTSWTYDDTTYQVYNEFIPLSSGSSWNDATGFVNALNTASYDGHTDWTLFSSKFMAYAWYDQYYSSVTRGDVGCLWSFADGGGDNAYCLFDDREWNSVYKGNDTPYCGFVVLRGSSSN